MYKFGTIRSRDQGNVLLSLAVNLTRMNSLPTNFAKKAFFEI